MLCMYVYIHFFYKKFCFSVFNCFLDIFYQCYIQCFSSCVILFYYSFIFLLHVFLTCKNCMCLFNRIIKKPMVIQLAIYLANIVGATDRITSQSSKGIDFYKEEADTNCLRIAYICLSKVIIVLPDTDVAVISLYQGVTNLIFLNVIWFKTGTSDDQRYIQLYNQQHQNQDFHYVAYFMQYMQYHDVSSFSHIVKITTV